MIQYLIELEINLLYLELAGLNFGRVQDVVYESQQVTGRGMDVAQVVALLWSQIGFQGQMA